MRLMQFELELRLSLSYHRSFFLYCRVHDSVFSLSFSTWQLFGYLWVFDRAHCLSLPFLMAFATRHEVLVVLLPLFARQAVFSWAVRIFAEFWILTVPSHTLRWCVALAKTLEVLKMPHELRLLERLRIWAVRILAETRIHWPVPLELLAHAYSMIIVVALVVIVDRLLKELITLRALWISAFSRVDWLSFLALYDKILWPTL